jgi:predicted nucleic acid-binding protein
MQEYADTSFLVSLYVFDANSAAANAHAKTWKRPPLLPFSPFGAFELNNTLRRVLRTKTDLTVAAKRIRSDLAVGIYASVPLQGYRLIEEADRISRAVATKHRARALDVLHLANVRMNGARTLLSFDHGQRSAALDLGFTVAP